MNFGEGWIVLLCLACLTFGAVIGFTVGEARFKGECNAFGKTQLNMTIYECKEIKP